MPTKVSIQYEATRDLDEETTEVKSLEGARAGYRFDRENQIDLAVIYADASTVIVPLSRVICIRTDDACP